MKRRWYLIALLTFTCVSRVFTQVSANESTFLNYSFNLMPDTGGTLNARADIRGNWNSWLSSNIAAYTDNYTQSFETALDVSTISSNGLNLAVTALRIDQDLLWKVLKRRLDFLEFSVGILAAYDWTEQNQYGYTPSATPVFYIDDSIKTVLRPLQSYSLGARLGPVAISGKFESTLYWSTETIVSSHFTSSMAAAPDPSTIKYSGGDTLFGSDLEVDLRIIRLIGGADYYSHVMTDGTKPNTSKSETWTYRGAMVLSFLHLAGGSPLIGASLVNKSDYFVARDENIETSTIRLEIGLRY